ncbi:hypothetical protein [Streptomyces sp. NBC_00370]|uniref:hypothetical protein n=1 Tax=Streptomyces sp. NBC_00370 TaxID=2975728 RepID=UPI002E26524A
MSWRAAPVPKRCRSRSWGDGTYAVDVVGDGPDGLVGESREVTSQHALRLDIPADGGVSAAATT